ncbi:MAG TPA: AraC family transcriptional regulator [Planctomycetota bacterium]|nr:AraC family transcriptional regulator [Planctomycetota bacterium]
MPAWLPRVVSMSCMPTTRGSACDWHAHGDADELCLVSDSPSRLGHAGSPFSARPDTLLLFRRGERHGYWNSGADAPHLWVVHYRADESLYAECPLLAANDPSKRVWRLSPERADVFKGLFLKIMAEHRRAGPSAAAAESAWLRLLQVAVHRWAAGERDDSPPALADRELLALWQTVNDHATAPRLPGGLAATVPNYDSLRHRFVRAFGASPRALATDLRIERAMSLLLESDLPVRDIAERVGYARQHEFARAFRRRTGVTPTAWRSRPVPRSDRARS